MNETLKVKIRLGFGLVFFVGAIGTFIFGWMERSAGNSFNQIWMLAIIMLLGAMMQLQKIGGGQKKSQKKEE
ncbi:MAG: hypothetical protein ISR82_06000 [Candidatus Marinimicrobia bacterium]|nr:hypothetical protein [Candidatus Neomarinimicrobiota bacterium]MBL7010756.1 hypothetical protein [Candidatus Neomarinimicrobiota bacterium]MBL7031161.1 hypothetical protein [Candidatus Neomarinimicrobiota bacterium]